MNSRVSSRLLAVVGISLVLGGCSFLKTTGSGLVDEAGELKRCLRIAGTFGKPLVDTDKDGNVTAERETNEESALDSENLDFETINNNAGESLDVALTCFIGPHTNNVPKPSDADYNTVASFHVHYGKYRDVLTKMADDDARKHIRLYRSHVIIAILGRYGAFKSTGWVGDTRLELFDLDIDTGKNIISAIHDAEYEVRRANEDLFVAGSLKPMYKVPATGFPTVQKEHDKLHRLRIIGVVLELAGESFSPTGDRIGGFVKELTSTIATPSKSGVRSIYKRIKVRLKELAILSNFGPAYLKDARADLTAKHALISRPPYIPQMKAAWQNIDKLVEESCQVISEFSNVNRDCTPGDYN